MISLIFKLMVSWIILIYAIYRGYSIYQISILPLDYKQEPIANYYNKPIIEDRKQGLFWFIQITDIHLSIHNHRHGLQNFRAFLNQVEPIVKPEAVFVTGDLTDAKSKDRRKSKQYEYEWKIYNDELMNAGILNKTNYWFDLRGNHDCFDVPEWQHDFNYFKKYSVNQNNTFNHVINKPYGKYHFTSLDGCPRYSGTRFFNFFGFIEQGEMDDLENNLNRYDYNHTFILSHYPITTTLFSTSTKGKTFMDISSKASVYLCGHLHELAYGLGEDMKSHHNNGLFEMELSDMVEHGSYRIISIDQDIINFVDKNVIINNYAQDKQPPIILITNIKDEHYILPKKEPIYLFKNIKELRFLIFNSTSIKDIEVTVNDIKIDNPIQNIKNSIYSIPFPIEQYNENQSYELKVKVEDELNLIGWHNITFNTQRTIPKEFEGFGNKILSSDVGSIFKKLFVLFYLSAILLLWLPKVIALFLNYYYNDFNQYLNTKMKSMSYFKLLLYRIIKFSNDSNLYYIISIYLYYIINFPIFYGNLENQYSHSIQSPLLKYEYQVFIYGFYFSQQDIWHPILDTYIFGCFQIIYILFYTIFLIYHNKLNNNNNNNTLLSWLTWIIFNCFISFWLITLSTSNWVMFYYYNLYSFPQLAFVSCSLLSLLYYNTPYFK